VLQLKAKVVQQAFDNLPGKAVLGKVGHDGIGIHRPLNAPAGHGCRCKPSRRRTAAVFAEERFVDDQVFIYWRSSIPVG
jgi:hypothetical protein